MINANPVSAGEALRVLQAGWDAQANGGLRVSWMLHGRPGVGKTEVVRQLASARGARLFDLRLTTIEPQDLRGLPYYDHERGRTVWYRPEDLPDSGPAILFLDELTAAAPSLQPTVYGLLQERRVGQHTLPDDVFIVAAGNSVEDGAVAYEMGTALADRLVHLAVRASADDWLRGFAVDAALHPAVTALIRARPDLLETTEEAIRRGQVIACTPRAWERVSRIMQAVPERRMRQTMIAGTVGEAAAAEFALIADEIAASVQVDDLLAAAPRDRAALYPETLNGLTGLIYALIAIADAQRLPAVIDCMAGIADLRGEAQRALPLAELTSFGFELLIRKALDNGWQAAFADSAAYARYAQSRESA
jgi:MoxR-like ATPase